MASVWRRFFCFFQAWPDVKPCFPASACCPLHLCHEKTHSSTRSSAAVSPQQQHGETSRPEWYPAYSVVFLFLCSATGNHAFHFCANSTGEDSSWDDLFFSRLERERDRSALFLGRRRCGCMRGFSRDGGKTLQQASEQHQSD